jgi:hypothetical protein
MSDLLTSLWLYEPSSEVIAQAHAQLGLPLADPASLAINYADVMLMNVPPYGTLFTDDWAELNTPVAQEIGLAYENCGYRHNAIFEVAAPDHIGLCLGFFDWLTTKHEYYDHFYYTLATWLPTLCLAIEREPTATPFYTMLAAYTRTNYLSRHSPGSLINAPFDLPMLNGQARNDPSNRNDEVRLRDIVRFFMIPTRSGIYLSRSKLGQMANILGLALPFGPRYEVAEALFAGAGENDRVQALLTALTAEVTIWETAYRQWIITYPHWQIFGTQWVERTTKAHDMLAEMEKILSEPLKLEENTLNTEGMLLRSTPFFASDDE